MAKPSRHYECVNCGAHSPKWIGRCSQCGAFNTMAERVEQPAIQTHKRGFGMRSDEGPTRLVDISVDTDERISTGIQELDRVFGGGITKGSMTLLGGDPGIGKSTLLLQVCDRVAVETQRTVLYVSGEESKRQIRMRSERLGITNPRIQVLTDTNVETICEHIRSLMPALVIIDSIQTMMVPDIDSVPGSVTQIRDATGRFMQIAKTLDIPMVLVGHVTKQGDMAGPKVLEHAVDTVVYFEGDEHRAVRLLRAVKNRFGNTNEIGLFEMRSNGLHEITNPSLFFMSETTIPQVGSAMVVSLEGTRPFVVEIQALTPVTHLMNPRRESIGVDYKRANLITAILIEKCRLSFGNRDVYLNAVGGVTLREPACDLGIAAALISSRNEIPIDRHAVFIGEIGLSGEVRPVPQTELRVQEAIKLGFKQIYVASKYTEKVSHQSPDGLIGVETITDLVKSLSRA